MLCACTLINEGEIGHCSANTFCYTKCNSTFDNHDRPHPSLHGENSYLAFSFKVKWEYTKNDKNYTMQNTNDDKADEILYIWMRAEMVQK